ncbi:MAG: tetratricopeptide repeat protein [Planctomycetota bacterium]|jgi:tetratricopeptide (TPR) repeat protein
MAKRLNKKVALIGLAFFLFFGVAAAVLIPRYFVGSEKFIEDGDAMLEAADKETDSELKEEMYEQVAHSYLRARARAKSDELRVKILHKLAKVYLKREKWPNVRGCWTTIVRLDEKDYKARFARLKDTYIMASNGMLGAWNEVASQASDFIEAADEALLKEDPDKLESFEIQQRPSAKQMGPYLYLLRGRANLEIAKGGAVTDRSEPLDKAMEDLRTVLKLEPDNIEAHWYLAQVFITKAGLIASKEDPEIQANHMRAEELLTKAVELADTNPKAHINLLSVKLGFMLGQGITRKQVQELEPEYLSLAERFDTSTEVFSALSDFYRLLGYKKFDQAIGAIEKAMELDRENVNYAIKAVDLHYRRFSIYKDKAEFDKAVEIANSALKLPNAQDTPGPRYWANKTNRASLYVLLATAYIEQVLEAQWKGVELGSQKQQWLAGAEQAVHEIEQIYGTGEEPMVVMWRSMLDVAKGEKRTATQKLYKVYEQFKASGNRSAILSYTLAKLFENTREIGATAEFFASAFSIDNRNVPDKIDDRKPEALLDFAEVLLKIKSFAGVLEVASFFEEQYWPSQKADELRIKAYIAAAQFDKAEEELTNAKLDKVNNAKLNLLMAQAKINQTLVAIEGKQTRESLNEILDQQEMNVEAQAINELKAELSGYRNAFNESVEKLLALDSNTVESTVVIDACKNYISEKKIEMADRLVNRYLEYFPDDSTILLYKQLLAEPDLDNISNEKIKEITNQVLSDIENTRLRAMSLGRFYQENNEPKQATEQFKKLLEPYLTGRADITTQEKGKETKDIQLAAGYLFDLAINAKDWDLAQQIVNFARQENIDDCEGNSFAARICMAKGEHKDALAKLNECLAQRPVFSYAYMLRSMVNASLGNEQMSIDDARKAASLNPLDGTIIKVLANALYQRNLKLGGNTTSDQRMETTYALIRAISLNPRDTRLQSIYAEYISDKDPENALAIRQSLQRNIPSMENALLLGRMAMKMVYEEANQSRKNALLSIAASSFEQAHKMKPENEVVLNNYAEYFRYTGQNEKAEELLTKSSEKLLWRHYIKTSRLEQAEEVLQRLYQTNSKDTDALRGLLLVAKLNTDKEAVKKYSEELLLAEETFDNALAQIDLLLAVGLVKDADYKLQAFKEKYPHETTGTYLIEALLTMKQGKLEKALELTKRSLEQDQENAAAWRLKGEINRLMSNHVQAVFDLKKSKSLSDEPITQLALAKAYIRAGRKEEAIAELKVSIENPQAPMESRILLERLYRQTLGKKTELKHFYDETLELFPDNLFWINQAGTFALKTGDYTRAEQLYDRVLWQQGKSDVALALMAFDGYLQALLLGGKLNKIFEEAGKYADTDFAPVAFSGMAQAKMRSGDKENAIAYFRKAIHKSGKNKNYISSILQRMYSTLGAKEVRKVCEEILKTSPDSLVANVAMFNLALTNAEYNKALRYIDRCMEITGPNSPAAFDYTVKKVAALQAAYVKTSDNNYLDRAIAEYESLIAKMPNNTSILNNLAYLLSENNQKLEDALQYAERVYEIEPDNPNYLDTYAYALYKNGKYEQAAEFSQAALQQFEQNKMAVPWDTFYHLGMAKEKLGARLEALDAYKQALKTGADNVSEAFKQYLTSAIERLSQN